VLKFAGEIYSVKFFFNRFRLLKNAEKVENGKASTNRLPCMWLRWKAVLESLHSCLLSVLSQAMREALRVGQSSTTQLVVEMTSDHGTAACTQSCAVTSDNSTALHIAAGRGHGAIVAQLLNHSPGLIDMKTAADDDTSTALHIAASRCEVKIVAELLARRPSSLAWEDRMGRTPLFWAVSTGDQELVDLFPLPIDQVFVVVSRILFSPLSFSSLSSLSSLFSFPFLKSFLVCSFRCIAATLLHLVFGDERSLKPAFIEKVWGMNPDALFVINANGYTPFGCAIWWGNEWAIQHFQRKLSMWSVEEALENVRQNSDPMKKDVKEPQRPLPCFDAWVQEERPLLLSPRDVRVLQRREQRFREVVQRVCEGPLLLLPRVCVHLCLVGFEKRAKGPAMVV